MNLKTKTNTVKQILAKVMLVILLLTSVLGLSGCEWENIFTSTTEDVDGGYGCIVSRFHFCEKFEELGSFIHRNNSEGYVYVTFNLDNTDVYLLESYEVGSLAVLLDEYDVHYLMSTLTIEGKIEMNNADEENRIIISFVSQMPSTYTHLVISEDTKLDVRALPDKMEGAKIGHYMYYGVYVGENKLMEFSIKSTSKKLSEEEFSQICDDLRKCLVVIG